MRIPHPSVLLALAAASALAPVTARAAFVVPAFRGAGSEYSSWDLFYDPSSPVGQVGNYPDVAAPNGIRQSASAAGFTPGADANPANPFAFWHVDNPTISQTDAGAGAFIIAGGITGNIYSFSKATTFQVTDTTPYTAQNVVFQFLTSGTEINYSSIKLNYDNGGSPASLFPTFTAELSRGDAGGGFGGGIVEYAAQWDLSGLGISSYTITFTGSGSSVSFQAASLDTSPGAFAQAVPEPGAGALALLCVAGAVMRRRRRA